MRNGNEYNSKNFSFKILFYNLKNKKFFLLKFSILFLIIMFVIQFMFIPYEYYKFQVVEPIERSEADYQVTLLPNKNSREITYLEFIGQLQNCSKKAGYDVIIVGEGTGVTLKIADNKKQSTLYRYSDKVIIYPLSDIVLYNLTTANHLLKGSHPKGDNDVLLNYAFYKRVSPESDVYFTESVNARVAGIVIAPLLDSHGVIVDDAVYFRIFGGVDIDNVTRANIDLASSDMWKYYIKIKASPGISTDKSYPDIVKQCFSSSIGEQNIRVVSKESLLQDSYERLNRHAVKPDSPTFIDLVLGIIVLIVVTYKFVNDLINYNSRIITFMMINGYDMASMIKLFVLEVIIVLGSVSLLSLIAVSIFYIRVLLEGSSFPLTIVIGWNLKYFMIAAVPMLVVSVLFSVYGLKRKSIRVLINEVS